MQRTCQSPGAFEINALRGTAKRGESGHGLRSDHLIDRNDHNIKGKYCLAFLSTAPGDSNDGAAVWVKFPRSPQRVCSSRSSYRSTRRFIMMRLIPSRRAASETFPLARAIAP